MLWCRRFLILLPGDMVATSLSLLSTLQELGVEFALVQPLDVIDAIYALRVDEGSYVHPSNSLKAFRWLCKTLGASVAALLAPYAHLRS